MKMGTYKKKACNDLGLGLAPLEVPVETKFELKGLILGMLKDIHFSEKIMKMHLITSKMSRPLPIT